MQRTSLPKRERDQASDGNRRLLLPGGRSGRLSAWYEKHLGIGSVWEQSAGTTAFSPFRRTSDYFPADRQAMLNLRVSGLDHLMQELEAAGIAVV